MKKLIKVPPKKKAKPKKRKKKNACQVYSYQMNDTPCPVCNALLEKRRQAFIKREYAALAYYENEHEKHRAKCDVVNGAWYLGLWTNLARPAHAVAAESEIEG